MPLPAYGIVGAQWGDEGKGKIVDFLAENADMVVRYSGGSNAGHTVINQMGEFALHLVPSGIFHKTVDVVIGPGVVVDAPVLLKELEGLHANNVDTSRLLISDHAHVVMPYHLMLDQLEEKERGGAKEEDAQQSNPERRQGVEHKQDHRARAVKERVLLHGSAHTDGNRHEIGDQNR